MFIINLLMLASKQFFDSMRHDMIAKVYTSIPYGYDGHIIEVECAITQGLPQFDIVGMANKTVSSTFLLPLRSLSLQGSSWKAT